MPRAACNSPPPFGAPLRTDFLAISMSDARATRDDAIFVGMAGA
jgi:precorrin-3B methylase